MSSVRWWCVWASPSEETADFRRRPRGALDWAYAHKNSSGERSSGVTNRSQGDGYLAVLPSGFILQQDNYPKHKSKLFTKCFHNNIVLLLLWLSWSPDFNLIEDPWDKLEFQVKDTLAHREHEKFPQLTTAQENIPQDRIGKPIQSMSRQCQAVIDQKYSVTKC
ncbi:hypothetical protein TELCIR_04993 [Teladorsagia circumcincta]|uniref:Tc1-like transposase DDE domain-containing protein n=1 Tax=Teladorsagia circumcincta TaxID=45464 RepID=A0A2G9USD0_TELCI|nr:hypothetical protein TELCIR_04993 [Teladorsagia circumcincta]